jgi:asparagine synthase (glutamine-hydrolysing)
MCGIAGVVDPRLDAARARDAVSRMCDCMAHRGPDDSGIDSQGPATLGSRRLAIFDPAHGHQPMISPDGRLRLVFNGALYNYRSLMAELSATGWRFRTACDTEVLLAAFSTWGEACLSKLRGMYAFAVWDTQKEELFLARGPFGIKPLYYSWAPSGGIIFASEIRAILASGLRSREIEPTAVGAYLAHLSVPAPETIYRGVTSLLPGQAAVWKDGSLRLRSHFLLGNIGSGQTCRSYTEFVTQLREQLDDSVKAHAVAEVPVGAFLSGGLDSSAIVALLSRQGARSLKTFTLSFTEREFSEQTPARRTAEQFGTEHHDHLLTGEEVAASLPDILAHMDQPTGDGINTYFVSRLAAQSGAKVVLSGLGGDELFGGYPSFETVPALARMLPLWLALPAGVRRSLLGILRLRPTVRTRKLKDFLANARDLHELASLQRRVFSEDARLELLEPETREKVARIGPFHPMLNDFAFDCHGFGTHRTISAWEMRTYMSDVLLADSDVFSMAHSIELRTPYLDPLLLGWLWRQKEDFVYSPGRYKGALSDAMSEILPLAVRDQTKVGFILPFSVWMRGPLRPFLVDMFTRESLKACPWLDAGAVGRLWIEYQQSNDTDVIPPIRAA